MSLFQIDADQFSWICGPEDDPEDLCLHGHVTVQIGDTRLEDWGTVSATALYLLKTLTEDKLASPYDIQMIPCCGHFLIPNDDLTQVTISGCDNGTDWSTRHEGDNVRLTLLTGEEVVLPLAEYREEVFRFADRIEAYYQACQPKKLPEDEFSRNGYLAFWNEWHRRRSDCALS